MGYDVHVCRSPFSFPCEFFPISLAEWHDLIRREPDLCFDPDHPEAEHPRDAPGHRDMSYWVLDGDLRSWFIYSDGRRYTKNHDDATLRRMLALGDSLDAWVTGDDALLYSLSSDGDIVSADAGRLLEGWFACIYIHTGSRYLDPIPLDAWMAAAAAQPDITFVPEVEAYLPSGIRTIPCPPVATWTGHPSGRQVPLFYDDGVITVRSTDHITIARMSALAKALNAQLTDGNDVLLTP